MKTAANVLVILVLGVCAGLIARRLRSPHRGLEDSPGSGEVVYTNTDPLPSKTPPSEVESLEVTRPPEDEEWLSRFELTERSGKLVKSEDLLGQPYIVSFFFTRCPSICPQQNQKIQELQKEFKGQPVRFLAISVDPEHDGVEELKEYAARFGADEKQWLFLTGDLTYIRRIGGEIFRQPVNKQFHTERFALVNPKGEIEGFYNWPDKNQMEKLKEKIREMIDQGKSQEVSAVQSRGGTS